MDMQACTQAVRDKAGDSSGLDATLKFDCGADGVIFVDATAVPNTVSNDDRDADCTIKLSHANLVALLEGRLAPTTAFMLGKIKVSGDMGVALKLQRVL